VPELDDDVAPDEPVGTDADESASGEVVIDAALVRKLEDMKLDELKGLAEEAGLPTTGTKKALIERLEQDEGEAGDEGDGGS
jgi:hypothetical protein